MRSAIGTMGIGLMLSVWLAGAAPPARGEARAALTVDGLRWDGRENPLGLIQFEPRLRWVVNVRPGAARGERQTAWQVLVASDPARLRPGLTDVWDSGKVVAPDSAAESINVRYGGPSPEARTRLYWTVRVWDAADRPSAFAPAGWAEMGLLDEEWEGQWIGRPRQSWQTPAPGASDGADRSVALLRRPFAVAGRVARARLYVSALGLYEVRMNGARIGAAELAPGYTAYAKRVLFQTHDVTALVRRGDNVLGAVVAGGWCTARAGGHAGVCGAEPGRIMVQLEVTRASGERQVIISDTSWQAHPGPWLSAHTAKASATTPGGSCRGGTARAATLAAGNPPRLTTRRSSAIWSPTRRRPCR
jgi:alpha-L-rhamnosidase